MNNRGYNGYYIGISENPTTYDFMGPEADSLYYPDSGQYNECMGYWIASASAYHSGTYGNSGNVLSVRSGALNLGGVNNSYGCYYAFRPVICLPSSILQ